MEHIKILIVEDDPEIRSMIVDTLSNVEYIIIEGETSSADEALQMSEGLNCDVMLISALLPGDGYKLAEKISANYPWISTIIVADELKEETVRKAIFAGAKDVLIYPFAPSKLVDSIYRSFKMEKEKQVSKREKTPAIRQKTRQGQVITVFSTKGGVGKTFISTNLAVSLSQNKGEKVVLVDLDLDFGNAALSLNVVPRYTITDVINDIRNLDHDLMKGYLTSHQSGIKLLASNAQPKTADFMNAEHIEVIIKILQNAFDYVIIDMPTRFYDLLGPAFQEADLLMLVTTQDMAAIRNIKAGMVSLNGLNYPRHKIKLLLNKAESRNDIKSKDIETTLGQALSGILPSDHKLVTSSLNKGIPVVTLSPRAKVSRSLQNLVRRIVENGLGEKDKTSSSREASS